ncbi:hypothetical protein F4703DRAFT_1853940 [Phycomyces blakesleeanus]
MRWLINFIWLTWLSVSFAVQVPLVKRQAVASSSCALRENTWGICSPSSTDIWYNGTFYEITWKYNNAMYSNFMYLDLYLLYYNNTQYTTIKTWPDLTNTQGALVQQVDKTWFPTQLPDNSPNRSWTMTMYMLGAGVDLETELSKIDTSETLYPLPTAFTLVQNAYNTTNVSTATFPSTSDSPAAPSTTTIANAPDQSVSDSDSSLEPWAIGVISTACVLVVAVILGIIWAARKMRKNKKRDNNNSGNEEKRAMFNASQQPQQQQDQQNHHSNSQSSPIETSDTVLVAPTTLQRQFDTGGSTDNRDIASINSATPMMQQGSFSMRSSPVTLTPVGPRNQLEIELEKATISHALQQQQQQQQQHKDLAHQSSSILSSTDALLIADTFRQFMRKPEWNEHTEDDLELQEKAQDAEEEKKRLGNQLLLRHLENEGTSVHTVEKRPALKNDNQDNTS